LLADILQFLMKEVNGSITNALDILQQRKMEGLLKCKHGDMEGLLEQQCKHLLFL
jgi:hypothetical protein